MKTLAIVQHTSAEYLGLIEDHLEGRRIRFRYFRPFTSGGTLPTTEQAAEGLVFLGGGPWGVMPGPRQLPTLAAEMELAGAALVAETPLIGIGLGAQIVALAAGGRAASRPLAFTVGRATRAMDDALDGFLPASYPDVRYQCDEVLLPDEARVLARDAEARPAAFRVGERAFGFLGHPGIKSAIVEDLVMEFPESPPELTESLRRLRECQNEIADALVPLMTGLVRCTRLMA